MKPLYFTALLFASFFIVAPVVAQQYSKLTVQFTDKNNSPYSFRRPAEFLSQRSIDRRVRYKIKPDSTDLPVNPSYIQQVAALGPVTYLSQSKWLNQILIRCSDATTIDAIRALPFVKIVNQVGVTPPQQQKKTERFKEAVKPIKQTVNDENA